MLIQQGIQKTLMGRDQLPDTLSELEKDDIMAKVASAIQLSLTDEVFRKVAEIEAANDLWKRLETLYMKKSLTNRLFLK